MKVFIAAVTGLFLSGICCGVNAQSNDPIAVITELNQNTPTGIRSMRVVSDSVIWVGGSNGYIGKTTNGGKQWEWMRPGGNSLDFRSLWAFDSRNAIAANAGSPAYIFRTTDGGKHWEKVYANADSAIFLDGMTFTNKVDGLIYGDPIGGHFVILKTGDGGKHWKMLPRRRSPRADSGEASFAASNSAIYSLPGTKRVWIGTGGTVSRIFSSKNFGRRWKAVAVPMIQGKGSTGIFSLAFFNRDTGICVGGDYMADTVRLNNALLTFDGGKSWHKPIINPYGYRSSVVYLSRDTLLATGSSGTDYSADGGATWHRVSPRGFNVIGVSREAPGKAYLAGPTGTIVRLEFSTKYEGKSRLRLKDK